MLDDVASLPADLLSQARDGSPTALGALCESQRGLLLLLAGERLSTALRAKVSPADLVQETFAEAIVGFDHFHGHSVSEFRSWLRSILQHNLSDSVRSYRGSAKRRLDGERRIGSSNLVDPRPGPVELAELHELLDRLEGAVAGLPHDDRELIRRHLHEGESLASLGRERGCTEAAMRERWLRLLARCRREIDEPRS